MSAGLLALLQEYLVVGLVNFWKSLSCGQTQAMASRPHLGLKREDAWTMRRAGLADPIS